MRSATWGSSGTHDHRVPRKSHYPSTRNVFLFMVRIGTRIARSRPDGPRHRRSWLPASNDKQAKPNRQPVASVPVSDRLRLPNLDRRPGSTSANAGPAAKSGVHSVRARSNPPDLSGQIDRDLTNATDSAEPCAPSPPDESRRAWTVGQVQLVPATAVGGEEHGPFDASTIEPARPVRANRPTASTPPTRPSRVPRQRPTKVADPGPSAR